MLTTLTHYEPYPHVPQASYQHAIGSGCSVENISYQFGVCAVCNKHFRTEVPAFPGMRQMDHYFVVRDLGKEEAHAEALAFNATWATYSAIVYGDGYACSDKIEASTAYAALVGLAERHHVTHDRVCDLVMDRNGANR